MYRAIWILIVFFFFVPSIAEAQTSEVDYVIIQQAARTSIGTQDFTELGFGTPQVAIAFANFAETNGVNAVTGMIAVGAYDGTNRWASNIKGEDNVTPTDGSKHSKDSFLAIQDDTTQTVDGDATASFITDGVRLDWVNAPDEAYLVNILLIRGMDQVLVGHTDIDGDVVPGTLSNIDIGFTPDFMFIVHASGNFNDNITTDFQGSMSFLVNDGNAPPLQHAIGYASLDNANPSESRGIVSSDRILNLPWEDQNNILREMEANSFISAPVIGVEVERLDSLAGTSVIGWVAFDVPDGVSIWMDVLDTPIVTGNQSIVAPGFPPQFIWSMSHAEENIGSVQSAYMAAGVGMATADEEFSITWREQNGANPSNATSRQNSTMITQLVNSGATGYEASLISLDSTGWTWNFNTVLGSPRKMIVLALSEEVITSSATIGCGSLFYACTGYLHPIALIGIALLLGLLLVWSYQRKKTISSLKKL